MHLGSGGPVSTAFPVSLELAHVPRLELREGLCVGEAGLEKV